MTIPRRALVAVSLLSLALPACSDEPEFIPTETTLLEDDVPLGDDEVLQHLLEAPELPSALEGASVTTSELRHPELFERHIVELVDVPAGASVALDEMLVPGALLRVPEGASVTVATAVDVAVMDGDTVAEVTGTCAAPCTVQGPAIVAAEGWLEGFAVQSSWVLLVPAPPRGG